MADMIRFSVATVLGLAVAFPLYYVVAGSFFSIGEFSSYPPTLFPRSLSAINFVRALRESMVARFMLNSLVVASVGSVMRIAIAASAAFAVVFLTFKGREVLFLLILGTMFLPADALMLENYLLISRMGLIDSYAGIISVHLLAPVQLFMLRQAYKSIPRELREAAMIDGSSDLDFFLRIVVPMTRPVTLVLVLQSFVSLWNAYLWPLLVTNDSLMRTVQVGITMLGYAESLDYGPTFAAISLIVVPSVVLFVSFRKRIVEGMASAAMG
jgi:sn-glycerol 3-phosphate transport system permease protein